MYGKDKKQADLKPIYTATKTSWTALEKLKDTCSKKYPDAIQPLES
jgi:hypothetical protein